MSLWQERERVVGDVANRHLRYIHVSALILLLVHYQQVQKDVKVVVEGKSVPKSVKVLGFCIYIREECRMTHPKSFVSFTGGETDGMQI